MEGVLYCKPQFEELFKESGNFNKNFTSPAKANSLMLVCSRGLKINVLLVAKPLNLLKRYLPIFKGIVHDINMDTTKWVGQSAF
nr:LIM domain-containing protein WLIM2b [Tanacetum cinerariifolium]